MKRLEWRSVQNIVNLAPRLHNLSLKRKHSLVSRTCKHLDRLLPKLTSLLNQCHSSNSPTNSSHSNISSSSRISLGTRLPNLCNSLNLYSFSSSKRLARWTSIAYHQNQRHSKCSSHHSSSPHSSLCNNSSNPNSKLSVQITNHIHKRACLGYSNQLVAITSLTLHNSAGNKKAEFLVGYDKLTGRY